jgi:hypothetical protein
VEGLVVPGDNPISKYEDDVLGRSTAARALAAQLLEMNASEGLVVGVLGAWGSGKTSFVNLARIDLESAGAAILDFNPWMFSGADQLVESFFIELAAQLKMRPGLAKVGQDLQEYGEIFAGLAWLPVFGPWLERGRSATKLLGKFLERKKEGSGARRKKLNEALSALDRPVAVILDDIDRLSTSEIRDIFKLVRLTASFPNVIYVLAFDRYRVERALAEEGISGRDYLEKILQVAIDLPAIPAEMLASQVLSAIDSALKNVENLGEPDLNIWPDIFMEVIRPLIRNLRDVRRYAASIPGTTRSIGSQIALADVLALEAVRIFLPDVFIRMHEAFKVLTGVGDSPYIAPSSETMNSLRVQVEGLVEAGGKHKDVVRAMIKRMFPAAERHLGGIHHGREWQGQWIRERRVAHADILRLYLERVSSEGLEAFFDAERAWQKIADSDALFNYLSSLDPKRVQDVIASLEVHEGEFSEEHIVPGSIALLNILPSLPERRSSELVGLDARLAVMRVVIRLLRVLGDQARVDAAVADILPKVQSLSSRMLLIKSIGYRADVGNEMATAERVAEFEKEWRSQVRSASPEDLAKERDLVRLFYMAKQESDPSEEPVGIPASPQLTLALLRAARSDARRQIIGSRAVSRHPRLVWDVLVDLYGDEATLAARIDAARAIAPDDATELLALADRYLSGWRPSDFGDD